MSGRSRIVRAGAVVGLASVTALSVIACKPYRIEYHRRPAFYQQMSKDPLPDRVVLDDGTIILYNTEPGSLKALRGVRGGDDDKVEAFKIRTENESGDVVLRSFLPEHVIANLLFSIRNEEYALIWDQLISAEAKFAYAAEGNGPENFYAFCGDNRVELAKMLNRMRLSFASHEVVVDKRYDGTLVCRFWPHVGKLFKFDRVSMVREGFDLKVTSIK